MEAKRTDPATRLDHDHTRDRVNDDRARRDDDGLTIAHAGADDTGYFPVPADAAAAFGLGLHREQRGQHGTGEKDGQCRAHVGLPPDFGFEPFSIALLRTICLKAQAIDAGVAAPVV
jgi:hypothetical protein